MASDTGMLFRFVLSLEVAVADDCRGDPNKGTCSGAEKKA